MKTDTDDALSLISNSASDSAPSSALSPPKPPSLDIANPSADEAEDDPESTTVNANILAALFDYCDTSPQPTTSFCEDLISLHIATEPAE